jgi:hypothetical protein
MSQKLHPYHFNIEKSKMLMESNYKSPGIDMIPFRNFMLRLKSFFRDYFGVEFCWIFLGICWNFDVFVDSFGDCR